MNWSPIARIIVRYVVGSVAGAATADAILGDPELMNLVVLGVSAAVGAGTEYLYTLAKERGWAT